MIIRTMQYYSSRQTKWARETSRGFGEEKAITPPPHLSLSPLCFLLHKVLSLLSYRSGSHMLWVSFIMAIIVFATRIRLFDSITSKRTANEEMDSSFTTVYNCWCTLFAIWRVISRSKSKTMVWLFFSKLSKARSPIPGCVSELSYHWRCWFRRDVIWSRTKHRWSQYHSYVDFVNLR